MKLLFVTSIILITLTSCKSTNIHLAADSKTGEYIGVVQNEVRDYESKEIIYYEVGDAKQLVKKLPQEIKIYEP